MNALLLGFWETVKHFVTVDLTPTTFGLLVGILGVLALLAFLGFFKAAAKSANSGKAIKWGSLILAIIVFGLVALLVSARFA
jgi:hypothetical protein